MDLKCFLTEREEDHSNHAKNESLFSLGNGYLGFRGNTAEISDNYYRGVFLNGFYELRPIQYGEKAYGFPEYKQTMLNLPDGRITEFYLDEHKLDHNSPFFRSSQRQLDLCRGILHRTSFFLVKGQEIKIKYSFVVHAVHQQLALQEIAISSDADLKSLSVHSILLFPETSHVDENDPRIGVSFEQYPLEIVSKNITCSHAGLWLSTSRSRMVCYCGMDHNFTVFAPPAEIIDNTSHTHDMITDGRSRSIEYIYDFSEREPKEIKLYKTLVYGKHLSKSDIKKAYEKYESKGFKALLNEHYEWWNNFWRNCAIGLEGDDESLLAARFSIFQLAQSAGRDGLTSVAAKGLSGEGYEGHYFWDTEIYMQPFFTYSMPDVANALLRYRAGHLDQAVLRAQELSQKGALYPWRTINGNESSAYFPAGTAQYHINADIIYALFRYLRSTDDYSILKTDQASGLRMAIETARFWLDLGFFNDNDEFCIHGVTGPDEYTALVNNNFYTNSIVRCQLEHTVALCKTLLKHNKQMRSLLKQWNVNTMEINTWKKAADSMLIAWDNEKAIYAQDDSFLKKEIWDFDGTPESKHPLLLHYHPLVIYRYQVLKQADAILAFFMEPHRWGKADKLRTFDYYEQLTTGDSSLSACIQGIVAAQLGRTDAAIDYFRKTAFLDIHDLHGNVKDGLHLAAAGGTWCILVFGFAGLDDSGEILRFNPSLPAEWKSLSFPLHYRQGILRCTFTRDKARFDWSGPKSLEIEVEYTHYEIKHGQTLTLSTKSELKAVIFDLDGVITDTAEFHYQSWQKLCNEHTLPFDRKLNRQLKGIGRMESLEIILNSAKIQKTAGDKKVLAEQKNDYYIQLLKQLTPADILPGINELLTECKKRNIRTALASASRNAPAVLERLKLEFDTIVDAALLKKGKPDPEIFIKAASQLKLREKYCVGIEDAAAGIQAIKSAGIISVGIGTDAKGADLGLKDTSVLTLDRIMQLF